MIFFHGLRLYRLAAAEADMSYTTPFGGAIFFSMVRMIELLRIFEPYGTDFYYVELIAPQEIRLKRNISENRLKNKASKRDIETSNQRLINDDKNHRCVSYEGEINFDNYLRIENSDKAPDEVAQMIKEAFKL